MSAGIDELQAPTSRALEVLEDIAETEHHLPQGHRIKIGGLERMIGGLERMANPAFGKNLSFCGTSSRVFTRFVVALVIFNKYTIYVQNLVIIENPRKLREKRRGGPVISLT